MDTKYNCHLFDIIQRLSIATDNIQQATTIKKKKTYSPCILQLTSVFYVVFLTNIIIVLIRIMLIVVHYRWLILFEILVLLLTVVKSVINTLP